MKKDEIIELLKEQIKRLRDDNNRLLGQVDALIKEVSSLKEALLQKGESLSKQQRLAKGLAKLVSNTSEQQQAPQPAMSEEERQKREAEKADKRKARKNNGAKRDMHYEMEEEEHVVYPDDPDFDINKARLFTTAPRICVRYECVPMRFIKHVYKIHTYTQDGRLFEGKTPVSAFLNSSYDGSFIAGLMELRYIQSLPVERIINYFEGHGFTLKKPTAHKLIEKASGLFENPINSAFSIIVILKSSSFGVTDDRYPSSLIISIPIVFRPLGTPNTFISGQRPSLIRLRPLSSNPAIAAAISKANVCLPIPASPSIM